ncbi:thioesterase-like superfamily-domain-containing protein [Ilyonectria sp. MPI-CAGE-AT-0026]|nr:thioesterase-like superfamily-domain-containing protein [Ilyonectria sp. MPI-CAGE-AT-0026]
MEAAFHTQSFEKAISVTPISSHVYLANLDSSWAIGDVPHGGYLVAILYRLTRSHFALTHPGRHDGNAAPIGMQIAYVRRCATGPAQLDIEDIKLGARTSLIRITLSQQNLEREKIVKLTGLVTVSNLASETGLSLASGWTLSPKPAILLSPQKSTSRDFGSEQITRTNPWRRVRVPHPEFRKATSHVEVHVAETASQPASHRHLTDQWAALRWTDEDGRLVEGRWTNEAAAFLLDVFPTALTDLEAEATADDSVTAPMWFPTLSLNIDFKKELPKDGAEWLFSRVTMKSIKNGRTDIEVVLMDESGELVALATQAGLVMSSARNRVKF